MSGFGRSRYVISWFFEFELDHFRDLDGRVEGFLDTERHSFEKHLESMAASRPQEEQDALYENHLDDYLQLRDDLPAVFRSSVLLALYSQFEHHLNELCDGLAREKNFKILAKDLADRGIVRSQKYMKKALGLEFPDQSSEWTRLRFVADVRNRIAHAGGTCGDELRKQVSADPLIKLSPFDEIRLQNGFITHTIDTMDAFVGQLDAVLEKEWKGSAV
jgi:hypothetical protein